MPRPAEPSQPSRPLPVRVLGTGAARPGRGVPSTDFDARFGLPDGTTEQVTGIHTRHVASDGDTSARLGARAATSALLAAGLRAEAIDCLVSACSVMQQAIPCLGAQIQRELGLGQSGIPAFDVNATCLSFIAGLEVAAGMIGNGRCEHVLLVSSELASSGVDPADAVTAPMFGDGAAAVVLGPAAAAPSALLALELATYGDDAELCQVRAGGTALRVHDDPAAYRRAAYFTMDGPALYRRTARLLPPFFARLLARAGVEVEQLACVVPHQASGKALDHIVRTLALPSDRVVRTLPELGNQVAASLPTALHHAIAAGRLQRGQLFALLGTGAGLSLGGAVLRY